MPELPDDLAFFRPTESSDMRGGVFDLDSNQVADYDAYRTGIGSVLLLDFEQLFSAGPVDSTVRITANPADVGPF